MGVSLTILSALLAEIYGARATFRVRPDAIPPGGIFTRGTLATQTNADGMLGWAPHNLLLWSSDLSQASWQALGGASKTSSTVTLVGGYAAYVRQVTLAAQIGSQVTFSAVLSGTPGHQVYLQIVDNGGAYPSSSQLVTLTATPTRYSVTRPATTQGTIDARFGSAAADTVVVVSECQLNLGPLQPYYPTTDSAYHGLRTADYSGDPARRGILIEPQATNLIRYSGNLAAAGWGQVGGSASTVITYPAPDAVSSITRIVVTASGGCYATSMLATPNTPYTASVYVRAGAETPLKLSLEPSIFGAGSSARSATFDLSSGGISSVSSGVTARATALSGGWWRCSVSAVSGTTPINGSPMTVYGIGSGGHFFAWGAQLEVGPIATSYIPTNGAEVTRGADVWSYPTSAITGWNAAAGALVVDSFGTGDCGGLFGTPAWLEILALRRSNSPLVRNASGNIAVGASIPAGRSKAAASYGVTSTVCVDGGSVSSGAGKPDFSAASLPVGYDSVTTKYLNGTLYALDYYPQALSAAGLKRITS